MRNNAHTHILGALKTAMPGRTSEVTGLDVDNCTESLNNAVIKWAAEMEIVFTRSRPYKKNDQAMFESKNNHVVNVKRRVSGSGRYTRSAEGAPYRRDVMPRG